MNYQIPKYKVQLVCEDSYLLNDSETIEDPSDIVPILKQYYKGVDREHFVVILLDAQNNIIGLNTVSIGSLNSCVGNPREVFKPALLCNAQGIIISHNHPSGNPKPSTNDLAITRRLMMAGQVLGISFLDHIIIGDNNKNFFSFQDEGIIDNYCRKDVMKWNSLFMS